MKHFLAIYTGNVSKPSTQPDEATIQKGMAAWGQWMQENSSRIIHAGGPLGKTKSISKAGVTDIRNAMTGYIILQAETHEEAAKLFENHPHFAIFPGEGVEVMECLPMPGV